jgi:hypothetical protein
MMICNGAKAAINVALERALRSARLPLRLQGSCATQLEKIDPFRSVG